MAQDESTEIVKGTEEEERRAQEESEWLEEITICVENLTAANQIFTNEAQRLFRMADVQVIHTYEYIKLQADRAVWLSKVLDRVDDIQIDTDESGEWDFPDHELYNIYSFEWNGAIFQWLVLKSHLSGF